MTISRLRAAIYARISTDKTGAGLGVDRQEKECQALAERQNWDVVEVFVDNDVSAYSGKKRPGYLAMLKAIEAGKVDAVVAWHTDRLHRSTVELEHYITVCTTGRGVPTQCVAAGPLDLSTASGRMVARQLGAVARYESEIKAERQRSRNIQFRAGGDWWRGRRPFGYDNKGVINPVEAALVRDGIQRLLRGESLRSITRRWRVSGVNGTQGTTAPTWTPNKVREILRNPRYAALAVHEGEVVGRGNWEALVSEDEHYAVAAMLRNPNRMTNGGAHSLRWIGSGLYLCAPCGATLRPSPSGHQVQSYRCRIHDAKPTSDEAGHVIIAAGPLDEHVRALTCRVLDEGGLGLLPTRSGATAERLAAVGSEVTAAQTRIDQLGAMFADGEITRDEWVATKALCVARLETATTALGALTELSPLDGVADAARPGETFLALPVDRQRQVVGTLMVVTVQRATRMGRPPKAQRLDLDRVGIVPRPGVRLTAD